MKAISSNPFAVLIGESTLPKKGSQGMQKTQKSKKASCVSELREADEATAKVDALTPKLMNTQDPYTRRALDPERAKAIAKKAAMFEAVKKSKRKKKVVQTAQKPSSPAPILASLSPEIGMPALPSIDEQIKKVGIRIIRKIRFSQDSISQMTSLDGEQVRITKLKKLMENGYDPQFPLLVVKMPHLVKAEKEVLTSFDNRRLYLAYKICEVSKKYFIYIREEYHSFQIKGEFSRRLENMRREYAEIYNEEFQPRGIVKAGTFGELIQLRVALGERRDFEYFINGYDTLPRLRSLPRKD